MAVDWLLMMLVVLTTLEMFSAYFLLKLTGITGIWATKPVFLCTCMYFSLYCYSHSLSMALGNYHGSPGHGHLLSIALHLHWFVWKLLHWPLAVWYTGPLPGVSACPGHYYSVYPSPYDIVEWLFVGIINTLITPRACAKGKVIGCVAVVIVVVCTKIAISRDIGI